MIYSLRSDLEERLKQWTFSLFYISPKGISKEREYELRNWLQRINQLHSGNNEQSIDMKKLIVVLIFISLAPIWSADTKKIPPEITAFLGNVQNDPNDEGVLPKTPEMYAFARFLAMNWKLLIAHFGEIAPDERMQRLIVFTAQVLPPREYVAFLNNLCDLRLEGKATKWATLAVLLSQSEKEAFLEYNYDRPEVAEVLRKLETIMSKDYPNEWKGYFQEAKSGKAKKDNEELYNELYNRTPESLDDGPSPLYKHLLATPTGTWGASKF